MTETEALDGKAAELARAFDRAFSETPARGGAALEDLLAIGVDRDPFALRLSELSGIFADKEITALPSLVPDLLGIAGFRGVVVPVYDLRALLGYRVKAPPRWWVLTSNAAGHDTPVALAFDRFEGQLRVPASAIAADGGERSRHVKEILRTGPTEQARPIVHLRSVLEAITERAHPRAPRKE